MSLPDHFTRRPDGRAGDMAQDDTCDRCSLSRAWEVRALIAGGIASIGLGAWALAKLFGGW